MSPEPLKPTRPFPWLILLILVGALFILGLAIFIFSQTGADRGEVVEPPNEGEEAFNAVGDTVRAGDLLITLNSAAQSGTQLIASFTFENQGQSDILIQTQEDFTAIGQNREPLLQDFPICADPQLPGTFSPDSEVTGNVCFRSSGGAPVDIIFRTSAVSEGAIIWRVD